MVPNFKVSGQPMTSQIRSNTRSGWHDTIVFGMLHQFIGADSKSGIGFALNNDPGAQGSCKVRIITAEMSHENGHGARDLA